MQGRQHQKSILIQRGGLMRLLASRKMMMMMMTAQITPAENDFIKLFCITRILPHRGKNSTAAKSGSF